MEPSGFLLQPAADLKTGRVQALVGSNPTPSALDVRTSVPRIMHAKIGSPSKRMTSTSGGRILTRSAHSACCWRSKTGRPIRTEPSTGAVIASRRIAAPSGRDAVPIKRPSGPAATDIPCRTSPATARKRSTAIRRRGDRRCRKAGRPGLRLRPHRLARRDRIRSRR
jgi:hypothetical protein